MYFGVGVKDVNRFFNSLTLDSKVVDCFCTIGVEVSK